LAGAIPYGGIYSGGGVTSGVFDPLIAGMGGHTISYIFTNIYGCSSLATARIHVFNPAVFSCGNMLTDIRDSRTYRTVMIGSQCWMADNLNFGTEIPSTQDQRDNCVAEKYHNPASSIQHPASVYQWDEIMQYTASEGTKGICPPAWHIPGESEWNTLFAFYLGNGFAGNPLKYTGYSGFNASLYGSWFNPDLWYFSNFATFFWSSTSHGQWKAWAHGFNDPDPSVSVYPSLRSNAFNVRCIKD
jgi:uncharacterized protein (TIGR02145 family)